MAQAFSVENNVLLGMVNFMNNWFNAFAFAGVWLPVESVIWPFRVFCYILPYRWAMPAFGYGTQAYVDQIENAYACSRDGTVVDGPGTSPVLCNMAWPDDNGNGFYCDDTIPAGGCLGRTGKQSLEMLQLTFATLTAENLWFKMTMLNVFMAVFWKIVHIARLSTYCNTVDVPKNPKQTSTKTGNGAGVEMAGRSADLALGQASSM
jgi:hypothetical protein